MSEFATTRRAKWFMLGSFVAGGLLVGHGTSRAPADYPESAPPKIAAAHHESGAETVPWNIEGVIGGVIMLGGVITAVPRRRPAGEPVIAAQSHLPAVSAPAPLLRVVPGEAA